MHIELRGKGTLFTSVLANYMSLTGKKGVYKYACQLNMKRV